MYYKLTDSELLNLLHENDESAFTEIYDRYWEKMTMHVLKVIHSPEDAVDIVQEVFLSIWKRRRELLITGTLGAYLLKSVRNHAIKYIEKNISKRNFLSSLSWMLEHNELFAQQNIEYKEIEDKIAAIVSTLPPKMKVVFVMSRNEQLSYKEIATQMGIAETTVKKQVNNAIKIIRRSVRELCISLIICLILIASI
ncbi:MAG TPA: RNA polymerase sigma-70 factor [Agriterribacter sp.]|nr:RNA polymerase sigma-70 factor [Chitinophagaceae bacterium]HRP31054.1 RNA polymerase sigma-70 factor [Agriterribacter sp.]